MMSEQRATQPIFDADAMHRLLADTARPLLLVRGGGRTGLFDGDPAQLPSTLEALAALPGLAPKQLGDTDFRRTYHSRYAYMTGAMANGIASAELVIAMGRAGLLASYGAGGVLPEQVEQDVQRIKQALGDQPFAVNLIHSPHEPLMERRCVEIFLKHGVSVVEASAFMVLTEPLIHYRLAGIHRDPQGQVASHHRVIAKISRPEVAERFMSPAPKTMVDKLVQQGLLSAEQAALAEHLPVADDITVEADSGGHTDRRPLTALLPIIIALRNRLQSHFDYSRLLRVGAAGGIGTPESALAAFSMGAAYVVTGSVNQSCVESGSSDPVRQLLAQADFSDVDMAPAADMFEMGVQLQVLKRGTLFPMRARQLYELYQNYPGLDAIPSEVRTKLEDQIFKRSLGQVWAETRDFFNRRDPAQIERAENDPKRKMALVFRSYLGQSSGWANAGVPDREMDYQIWAGPAMGAFNDWVAGSYLDGPQNRRVVDVAEHIMRGCAYQQRLHLLGLQHQRLPEALNRYPLQPLTGEARRHAA